MLIVNTRLTTARRAKDSVQRQSGTQARKFHVDQTKDPHALEFAYLWRIESLRSPGCVQEQCNLNLSNMATSHQFDAYAKPPVNLRNLYKKYQKHPQSLDHALEIIDFRRGLTAAQQTDIRVIKSISKERLTSTFDAFMQSNHPPEGRSWSASTTISDALIYEPRELPGGISDGLSLLMTDEKVGLYIMPSLLPPDTQLHLLECLLHRDLSNPQHKTNIHAHYNVQYPLLKPAGSGEHVVSEARRGSCHSQMSSEHASFFTLCPASGLLFQPKDPELHKPLTMSKFLERKLRWVTLGGQYDWINKSYPAEPPPGFPRDIADLLTGIFPDMKAEAAIVNIYTPGDTLSVHRDVSEDCDRGLVSLSLGCDGLFIIGIPDEGDGAESSVKHIVLRLRSGDAVYMSGASRFAWHGVPQVIGGTCPDWLRPWPAKAATDGTISLDGSEAFESWRNWMETKRINLNVRQMKD